MDKMFKKIYRYAGSYYTDDYDFDTDRDDYGGDLEDLCRIFECKKQVKRVVWYRHNGSDEYYDSPDKLIEAEYRDLEVPIKEVENG